MHELVIEQALLPKQVADWLEAESEQGKPSLLILRKENERYILQRVHQADPAVMRIAREVSDEYIKLLERLADA